MTTLKQTLHVLMLFLGMHRARLRDGLLIVAGFVLAAATLAVLLAIPSGLQRLGANTGRDDIAMVIGARAIDEASSSISAQEAQLIGTLPQVARDARGEPLLATQFIGTTKLARRDGVKTTVQVRGVDAGTWAILGEGAAKGRLPADGARELLAGVQATAQFPMLAGNELTLRDATWAINGRMDHGGNLWDSELWAELSAVQAAYRAPSRFSVVLAKLGNAADFDAFNAALKSDPRLSGVQAQRQSSYYAKRTGFLAKLMGWAALGIAVLLGAGAALAIANALSSVLERRRREAGALRALGFRSDSVLLASLLEVLLLGAIASAAAFVLMHLLLHGRAFGTSSGGHAIYAQLQLGADVGLAVLGYALLLGLLAALLPVRRLAFGKILAALRAD
ncbi:MAG: FtsX-like permease family protein [Pseudomonadota bacterium]|nr:FtsX-like permease family protein [Pseudomonadota bacterium]